MLKNFKEFIGSLLEKQAPQTYDYGCAMAYFDFPQMSELHSQIDENDVYTEEGDRSFGLEDNPHTTLLYGLHSTEIDDSVVMEICKSTQIGPLKLSNVSMFENEKYDVLKFDVENPNLYKINEELSKLPHTTNFPNYHPHATIGYIKKGSGKKYVDALKDLAYDVTPSKIVYSKPGGDKIEESLL